MRKTIEKHVKIALAEIGAIQPWWDEEVSAFVFEHEAYPVRYAGDSEAEVIENYPKYLQEFIEERLKDNLAPQVEAATPGCAGKRPGTGRLTPLTKPRTKLVRVPAEVADWLKANPEHIEMVRKLMR
jgi:hypothetical protein